MKKHKIWLKAIATAVVCLFMLNDLAYPLAVYSRFKPFEVNAEGGLKEDAGFLYLGNLIGQALSIEKRINEEVTPGAVKLLARKHVGKIDFTRFKWQEIYREGKAFCLPYARRDDDQCEQILKFFHPEDSAVEFPHRVLLQFNDGTKVILEDPLKETESEASREFIEKVRGICMELEPDFFREFRKKYPEDRGYCFDGAYVFAGVLSRLLKLPVGGDAPDRIEWEIGEKPGAGILGDNVSHIWVAIYKGGKKTVFIDATHGQYQGEYRNRIWAGEYGTCLEVAGLRGEDSVTSEKLQERTAEDIAAILENGSRKQDMDAMAERILLLHKIRKIVLETREFWEGFGACQRHSTEIVRRLLKEGINARVMKHATITHWFVEAEDYVIDGFPKGATQDYIDAAAALGDERFVITEKDSDVAKRLYQGAEDSEMTAEAKNDTEDEITFFTKMRDRFSIILRECLARGIAPPASKYAERITAKLAKAEEKLRLAQERRRNERMRRMDDAKSPPPGNVAALLKFMFGYDFADGKYYSERIIGRDNPKKAADMVGKRGGKDGRETIRREIRVLKSVGLIEGEGKKGYYLTDLAIALGCEYIIEKIPELNQAPSTKENINLLITVIASKWKELWESPIPSREAPEDSPGAVLEVETHSKGMHERPAKALADTCGKLYKILPGVKVVFAGDGGRVRVENPDTVLSFEELRESGEKEGGRFVYRSEVEVVVSGDYPDEELRKAASVLAILVEDERFRDGFDPDEPVKGPDGRKYTGDALEAEIGKKLNELEAARALKSVILAKECGAAGIKKELLDDSHSICFYWKKVSEGAVLPKETVLRQGLTEAGAIARELESLPAGKTGITENKELIKLIEDIGRNALGYHSALSYLLEYSGESLTSARSVAVRLLRSLENIEGFCRQILGPSGEDEEVFAYEETGEVQVSGKKSAKEKEEKKINISKELPAAKGYLDQLADYIKLFMKQDVKTKPVIDDDIDEAEEGEDDDDGLLNLKGPSDRDLKKIEVRPEVDLEIDVLSWERATGVAALLRYITERTEKLTKIDLKLISGIHKAASKCLRAFKDRKKGALLSKVDLDKYGFRAVNMTWRLEDIVRLCGEIALTEKNPTSDGSPHRIFEILRTTFSGRYAVFEAIQENTKNGKGDHLSLSVLKRDLGTLVSMGIVEKKVIKGRALFRAVDLGETEWRLVEPVLKSLGKEPTKKQKDLAREKVAKEREEISRSAPPEQEGPVERDIRFYSQRYGSDNPFMILSVALKKLNWPVIQYLVYYLRGLLTKGHKPTILEEHIFLSAEHSLEQYLEKIQMLQDLGSNATKLPPADGSPARCLETIFLSESLRQKSDISAKKDLWPEREKEMAGVSLRTVQKEVEILGELGVLVQGDKPYTYKLRPELQNLPPPQEGELPEAIKKICEIEHEGIRWLGRYDIEDAKIIEIVRSKVESIIERHALTAHETGLPASISRYYSNKEIPVRNPGGIKEEQAVVIKRMAELLYDKWGVDIYIRKKYDKTYYHATDVFSVRGLKIRNREKAQVTVMGYAGSDDPARKKLMLSRALDLVERLLQDPWAMTFSVVDAGLLDRYFEEASSGLGNVPRHEATFPCAYDIYEEDNSSLQTIFAELAGHNIMWSIAGGDEPGRPLTVNLTGGKSEEQLKRIMSVIGGLINVEQGRLSREDRARALVTHDMVLAILGEEVKDDFPKKEMDGPHKHPFFPREKLFWSANSHSGNIDFTLGQRKWGRFEIFIAGDGKTVYVTPYIDDIRKGDETEYFSMDISSPEKIGSSLVYRYGNRQVSLGELLPGSSLGPKDKMNRNRVIGILSEALSLRKEMAKRPGLDYYFMIDRLHKDESMDVLSRNVLAPEKDPRQVGSVEMGTPIPDFYATDPHGHLALLVESGTYTPRQLAEKLFNGYWVLTGNADSPEVKGSDLDIAEELVLSVNIPRSKKKGDFTRRARKTIEFFLLQLKYKKQRGEAVKAPSVITVEDLYSNLSATFQIDTEKLEIKAALEVSRFSDISRFKKLQDFIFASEKEIAVRRENEKTKTKVKRIKELFGGSVITDEFDLDYGFQQHAERIRRKRILDGNEGGVEVLKWLPQNIMLSSLLRCTNQCAHCLESAGPHRKEEMSAGHIARALDTGEIMLNNPVASIVGGEVLLRSDLMEIIGKFPVYSLTTNAATMATKEVAERFIKDLKANFKVRTAAAKSGFTISKEQLHATGGDPYLAAWAQYVVDSSADLSKARRKEFRVCISLDDFHMAQHPVSAAKIANLIEAAVAHYPEMTLSLISAWHHWGEAFVELREELERRGFSFEYDPAGRDFVLTKGDWKKRIAFGEDVISRVGRAIYLPDESDERLNFSEFDIWEFANKGRLITGVDGIERITLNHAGELTLCDSWVAEHGPLFFGNVVEEGWGTLLKRVDKDPLFRAFLGSPADALNIKHMIEIAEEYDPGIAERIRKGKPGDIISYLYWLFSNPERKLYITYRLLNESYEKGILKGKSPCAGMSNDEIKALARREVSELREAYREGRSTMGQDRDSVIVDDFCDAVMARLVETAGKEEKQNIIIGIDTSWLPFDQKNGKLEKLLGRVKEKFKILRQLGGVNVTIITEEGEKLAQEVAKAAGDEKTGTDFRNIAILGSKNTLSSDEFGEFMERSLLVEVEAGYFSLEMITLAFKLLTGFKDPHYHEVIYEEKNPRYYIFKARPVDPSELLDKYDLQTRLLEKHA